MGKQYDVILLEGIHELGNAGETKTVKKGFALNYLIPKGLAAPVTKDTLNQLSSIKKKEEKRLAELKEVAGTAEALDGKTIKFEVATTDDGKLYGSIDANDVIKEVSTQFNIELDKKILSLKNPIKEAGETQVAVALHPELQPQLTVVVIAKMTEAQRKKLAEKEKQEKALAEKKQEAEEAAQKAEEEAAAVEGIDIVSEEDQNEESSKKEAEVNTEEKLILIQYTLWKKERV